MQNAMLRTLTWALVFGIVIPEVISQLLSTDTPAVNRSNSDFSVTPQIPEDSATRILSLATSTPNYPEDEEGNEEDEDEDGSILSPELTTTLGSLSSSTLPPEITTSNPNAAHCPVISDKQVARTLVKCQCKGDEVLNVDGQCQHYPKGTIIPAEKNFIETEEVPVTNFKVIVRDVKCDPGKGRLLNFTKEKFMLRFRGDLVLLKSAGDLYGQRINNYCITHHLDEHSDLTVMAKVCVPVPAVPRCCPPGQAMKDGSCQPANTPDFLMPPIGAKPFHHGVEWPNITNYLSPLTCTNDPVKTIPLSYKESNLVSLALGVQHAWLPAVIKKRRLYYSCPNYCVDGIENPDGSISYFTSFCYSNPKERHEQVCAGRPCLRKCCKLGEVMDVNRFGCVPVPNQNFNPPTKKNVSNYNIAIGWPLCTPSSKTNGTSSIDESGILIYKGRTFPSTDYCVDIFVNNDVSEIGILACLISRSLWHVVRPTLFPVCNVISLFFLSITIACHFVVPKLLKNGGVHQLCHSVALTIAYISSIGVNVSHEYLNRTSCFPIAITMQFGYLTTFFWLNVMCFEIWRKIRRLKMYRPCKNYPTWYYMLYAWGIPFVICVITVMMQLWAPENVPGLIKPYIGESRCWFKEDIALFIYFYGPIAALVASNTVFLGLTYYNYKHMMRNYKETTKCLREMGAGVNATATTSPPKTTSSMPSRQLTDHVQEFKQKLQLFVLMATCWVTEILSWKIPPPELWALTDTLNSLQGLFIFIILLSNRNKRKQLEEKFPRPFKMAHKCMKIPSNIKTLLYTDGVFLAPVNSFASSVSRKFSNSTLMTSFPSSIKSSSNSSLSVAAVSLKSQRSVSLDDSENGIVTLSHSPLQSSKSCSSATSTIH